MSPSVALSSISTEARAAGAAGRAMLKERLYHFGQQGYLLTWIVRPIFDLAIGALIYAQGDRTLIPYLVVAMSANALVWNTLYWVGEILDRERVKGTLVCLFLTPCSRFSWLLGFTAAGLLQTVVGAITLLATGTWLFDVRLQPNYLSLALILPLYVAALLGLGFLLSAVGLLTRRSNQVANLIFPALMLLGGSYYPVERLPDLLRIPARALPIGYAMEALAAATLQRASPADLISALAPLALFALALPVCGVAVFRALERRVRERGDLDLF